MVTNELIANFRTNNDKALHLGWAFKQGWKAENRIYLENSGLHDCFLDENKET